jgi:hypothetical protein
LRRGFLAAGGCILHLVCTRPGRVVHAVGVHWPYRMKEADVMRFRTIMLVGVPAAAVLAVGGGAAASTGSGRQLPENQHAVVQTVPHESRGDARHEVQAHVMPPPATRVAASATASAAHHAQPVKAPAVGPATTTCSADHRESDARHETTATSGQQVTRIHHDGGDQVGHGHD